MGLFFSKVPRKGGWRGGNIYLLRYRDPPYDCRHNDSDKNGDKVAKPGSGRLLISILWAICLVILHLLILVTLMYAFYIVIYIDILFSNCYIKTKDKKED